MEPSAGMNNAVPNPVPEHCPGTSSNEAGKADACAGCPNQSICATAPKGEDPDLAAISDRLKDVKHKILVLSGKGGVGKSTVSAQLAFALAAQGLQVGLLDIDICGPSIPKMLGLEGQEIHQSNLGWSPVYVEDNLGVMSIGFMLPNPDEAVVWRGPRKNGLIKQFLKDVHWGALDYLICLRATSSADGAVIVTTPQEVSIIDVRKEVSFCRKVGLPVLGVVENMSGLQIRLPHVRFVDANAHHSDGDANAGHGGPGTVGGMDCSSNGGGPETRGGGSSEHAPAGGEGLTERVHRVLAAAFPGMDLVAHATVFTPTKGGAGHMCRELGIPLLGQIPLDPSLGLAAEEGRSVAEPSCVVGTGKPGERMRPAICLPALMQVVSRIVASVGGSSC
ncbi:MAG: hypothetical protein WDW38_000395 [Sanguina aurantia]